MRNVFSSIYSLVKNKNAMNDKDSELMRIARIVTYCCVSDVSINHSDYIQTSRAYRIALSEATIKCKGIEANGL